MRSVGENPRLLESYAAAHRRCACCWIGHAEAEATQLTGLQVHHVIRRSRTRCDEHANLLMLCQRCHQLVDGDRLPGYEPLTIGHCLWLKFVEDRHLWNPRLLERLCARRLPDFEGVPAWALRERERRQPVGDWRNL